MVLILYKSFVPRKGEITRGLNSQLADNWYNEVLHCIETFYLHDCYYTQIYYSWGNTFKDFNLVFLITCTMCMKKANIKDINTNDMWSDMTYEA